MDGDCDVSTTVEVFCEYASADEEAMDDGVAMVVLRVTKPSDVELAWEARSALVPTRRVVEVSACDVEIDDTFNDAVDAASVVDLPVETPGTIVAASVVAEYVLVNSVDVFHAGISTVEDVLWEPLEDVAVVAVAAVAVVEMIVLTPVRVVFVGVM